MQRDVGVVEAATVHLLAERRFGGFDLARRPHLTMHPHISLVSEPGQPSRVLAHLPLSRYAVVHVASAFRVTVLDTFVMQNVLIVEDKDAVSRRPIEKSHKQW